MTIQRRTFLGATIAAPAILSAGTAFAQGRGGPIRIGMAGPLTGANATFGTTWNSTTSG